MNRSIGLFVGLLATTTSLVTTIKAQAVQSVQLIPHSEVINHTYTGVHRCGGQQDFVEAENAARNRVNMIERETGLSQSFDKYTILGGGTREWEEYDKFGFSKGRKCETTMRIQVDYSTIIK